MDTHSVMRNIQLKENYEDLTKKRDNNKSIEIKIV